MSAYKQHVLVIKAIFNSLISILYLSRQQCYNVGKQSLFFPTCMAPSFLLAAARRGVAASASPRQDHGSQASPQDLHRYDDDDEDYDDDDSDVSSLSAASASASDSSCSPAKPSTCFSGRSPQSIKHTKKSYYLHYLIFCSCWSISNNFYYTSILHYCHLTKSVSFHLKCCETIMQYVSD